MDRKRILILANNSGGLYRFRKELISRLIEDGYDVIASTPFDDNITDLKKMNIQLINTPINRRGMNPIKDFSLLIHYFQIIQSVQPDEIITYTIKPNLYGGLASMLLNKKYSLNITGLGTAFQKDGLLKKMVILWYRFICLKVKVVFFENIENQQIFLDNRILDQRKCCVLHGAGVNLDDFYVTPYPEDDHFIHFLFIGRIMKEKGVEELFQAMEKLHKYNSNVVLDILGNYEDDYIEKISELEQQGIIQYHGYQDDVRPFIQQCHCFVLPSYHEGMANTLLECASMGRPLITSDIHGCKEAISDNGFLCQVQDAQDLYQKLLAFIALPYERKKQMGLNSRKHMEAVFDKKKVVEETLKGLRKEDDDE